MRKKKQNIFKSEGVPKDKPALQTGDFVSTLLKKSRTRGSDLLEIIPRS